MNIPEEFFPYFCYEIHRYHHYLNLANMAPSWNQEELTEENRKANLLSMFQYRMYQDPGFQQHVLTEIANDEGVFTRTLRYIRYLWYSSTIDVEYCMTGKQPHPSAIDAIRKRVLEIISAGSYGISTYLYRYAHHSILDSQYIMQLREQMQTEHVPNWSLVFFRLTGSRLPYTGWGDVLFFGTKGGKDPVLKKKIEHNWRDFFSEKIRFSPGQYFTLSKEDDADATLHANETVPKTGYVISLHSNREPEANLLFTATSYMLPLRKRFAEAFDIEVHPIWNYVVSDSMEQKYEVARPYLCFQKFTTDCLSIAAEIWFSSKSEEEKVALLNKEWIFSLEPILNGCNELPLDLMEKLADNFLENGCVTEAHEIYSYLLDHTVSPERLFLLHLRIGDCSRIQNAYSEALSHYSRARDIVSPYQGTEDWYLVYNSFHSPDIFERLTQVYIREMNHQLGKKKLSVNAKKFMKVDNATFQEKSNLANEIWTVYSRCGLQKEAFEFGKQWDISSIDDQAKEYSWTKDERNRQQKESMDWYNLGNYAINTKEDDLLTQQWNDRDNRKKNLQSIISKLNNAFQPSYIAKHACELYHLPKFMNDPIPPSILIHTPYSNDMPSMEQNARWGECAFDVESTFVYGCSLYKSGEYDSSLKILQEYGSKCSEYSLWDISSEVTIDEINTALDFILYKKKDYKKISLDEYQRDSGAWTKSREYTEDSIKLGLWDISSYLGCCMIHCGDLEGGISVFRKELVRVSKIPQTWERSQRLRHFMDCVILLLSSMPTPILEKITDMLEDDVIKQYPGYYGMKLLSDVYCGYFWMPIADKWFKSKKHDRNLNNLPEDDKARLYQIKATFYLNCGKPDSALKILDRAKSAPYLKKPSNEQYHFWLTYSKIFMQKRDFAKVKECYLKIQNSGVADDDPYFMNRMKNIEDYFSMNLVLGKQFDDKCSEAKKYFEKAELESISFYLGEQNAEQEKREVDCSAPLIQYAWGLDKYLYTAIWEDVREYVFSYKYLDSSSFDDLKDSSKSGIRCWYSPFERNSINKSTERSPTLGNWYHLFNNLNCESDNPVFCTMVEYLKSETYGEELLEVVSESAGLLLKYRNDICHADPVLMTIPDYQKLREKIVSSLTRLFTLIEAKMT